MRVLLSLLLVATISSAAGAQTTPRVEIVDFGIYTVGAEDKTVTADTASGVLDQVAHLKLAEATTTVPGRLGVHFGFRYKVIASALAADLKIVTLIPKPGIRNPKTGKTTERSEYHGTDAIGTVEYAGYGFDYPWEIVLGTWRKEIWEGDRKLASQSFNVVKPTMMDSSRILHTP